MYRAVTLFGLKNRLISDQFIDIPGLINKLNQIGIEFRFNDNLKKSETYLNGENVEEEIRDIEVSKFVSPLSTIKEIREKMVELQRSMADKQDGVVMDGRDIGTVVFPNADIKLFLIADEAIRAERRFDEMKARGSDVSFQAVIDNIKNRDYQDSNREISPLVQARDAIVLDNSGMGVDDQMIWFRSLLNEKYGKKNSI
jgi:cytidylate kinase